MPDLPDVSGGSVEKVVLVSDKPSSPSARPSVGRATRAFEAGQHLRGNGQVEEAVL
jgi:hypothetical protein